MRVLSGGERARLMLARALALPSNLLVLDEPTNDLDLETLDVLEEMLGDYAGTVLLISHDRDFLDRVVNAVIVPEGDGRWVEYAGGYTDMLAQRGRRSRRQAGGEVEAGAERGQGARRPSAGRRRPSASSASTRSTRSRPCRRRSRPCRRASASCSSGSAIPASTPATAAAFTQGSADLAARQAELSAAEHRWLELEILREELEGG